MSKYEVWSEGYVALGNSANAKFHGEFDGESFRDACIAWSQTLDEKSRRECFYEDELRFWNCKLFDNEVDARKSYG